jgi:fatty acid-binding protein DegV
VAGIPDKVTGWVESRLESRGRAKIAFMHAAAREQAEELRQMFEGRIPCPESIVAELSPALGVHSGPGTVGVCYFSVE